MKEDTGAEEVLPDRCNGYDVYAKCQNCGRLLTINNSNQTYVHVHTYDRDCRISWSARPDRHQRWAKW